MLKTRPGLHAAFLALWTVMLIAAREGLWWLASPKPNHVPNRLLVNRTWKLPQFLVQKWSFESSPFMQEVVTQELHW